MYFIMTRATTELPDTHPLILQQICNGNFVQEQNIFSVFGSNESELLHVKHSAIDQNLLQVTTC